MSNEIFSAPRDRGPDPRRSVGSGPSMVPAFPGPKMAREFKPQPTPKFGGDPGFKGPSNRTPNLPKPGMTTKPKPYQGPIGGIPQKGPYRGPIGGVTKTMPYTQGQS